MFRRRQESPLLAPPEQTYPQAACYFLFCAAHLDPGLKPFVIEGRRMALIASKNWLPLLTPQILFSDRQGQTNAFLETNPALWIEPDGSAIVCVRLVNYRKFKDRSFKMGGALSESKYHIFRGRMKDGMFEAQESSALEFVNALPLHPSCWTGYEDLRFLNSKQILCTAPQLSPRGLPVIALASLDGSTATIQRVLPPSEQEKNWMPFLPQAGSRNFVLYSVSPLGLKQLEDGDVRILATADPLRGYHGSSNGVSIVGQGFLFLIHKYAARTEHAWLLFDPIGRRYGYSAPFVFLEHSYIEFTCSISLYEDMIHVALGVNDDKAYLCSVSVPDPLEFTWLPFS